MNDRSTDEKLLYGLFRDEYVPPAASQFTANVMKRVQREESVRLATYAVAYVLSGLCVLFLVALYPVTLPFDVWLLETSPQELLIRLSDPLPLSLLTALLALGLPAAIDRLAGE